MSVAISSRSCTKKLDKLGEGGGRRDRKIIKSKNIGFFINWKTNAFVILLQKINTDTWGVKVTARSCVPNCVASNTDIFGIKAVVFCCSTDQCNSASRFTMTVTMTAILLIAAFFLKM